jgi:hypothetical protein
VSADPRPNGLFCRLGEDLYEELRDAAYSRDLNMAQLLRRFVRRGLDDLPSIDAALGTSAR